MLREKYNVVISREDKIEVKSFKEGMKSEAEKYFNTLVESLHKKGVEDWNGVALVENYEEIVDNCRETLFNLAKDNKKLIDDIYEHTPPEIEHSELLSDIDDAIDCLDLTTIKNLIKKYKKNESINNSYKIVKTDGFANAYWDMIINEGKGKPIIHKLYEEVEIDLDAPTIINPVMDINMEQESLNTGLANLLVSAINSEWNVVNQYNDFIITARSEDRLDIVAVLQDIVNEENTHIGQLQELLKSVKPETAQIMQGELEAQQQIADIIPDEPVFEEFEQPCYSEMLTDKLSNLKYNLGDSTSLDANSEEELCSNLSKYAITFKILEHTFGENLVSWNTKEDYIHVILKDSEKDVRLQGMAVIDMETGREIIPGCIENEKQVFAPNIGSDPEAVKVTRTDDDMDYINNFR